MTTTITTHRFLSDRLVMKYERMIETDKGITFKAITLAEWAAEMDNPPGQVIVSDGINNVTYKPVPPAPDWPALMSTAAFAAYCDSTLRADDAERRAESEYAHSEGAHS